MQYANLLWKEGRKDDSRKIYGDILAKDATTTVTRSKRWAISIAKTTTSKWRLEYFNRLAKAYPDDYIPYLALGDLYTQTKQFQLADDNYQQAYKIAPENPLIIANAANAAIEAQQIKLAGVSVGRAKGKMNDDPRVMRERERYLFHEGDYAESAKLGYQVLQQLPKDRNASVYLAYDLYNMGRYDDALAVSDKYDSILPNEPNFPLLEGHVHKHSQLLDEAVDDYGRAIQRDPRWRKRIQPGYSLNDMQNAQQAAATSTPG